MKNPWIKTLFATGIAALLSIVPLAAQEDPFAPAEQTDPFGGETPDPFAQDANQEGFPEQPPSAGIPPVDPFGRAAGSSPFDQPQGGPFGEEPGVAPSQPFAGDPDTTDFGAPAPPAGFGEEQSPEVDITQPGPFGFQPSSVEEPPTGPGIGQLYEFRYTSVPAPRGQTRVDRVRLTKEEAEAFDLELFTRFRDALVAGEYAQFDPGAASVDEWATWLRYAEQVRLWVRYIDNQILLDDQELAFNYEWIYWPGEQQAEEAAAAEQEETVNIYNQSAQPMDDQLGDFFVADTRQGAQQQASVTIDPAFLDLQTRTMYNAYLDRLRQFEDEQNNFIAGFKDRLDQREEKRLAFAEWKEDSRENLEDFVTEWNRRYTGEVLTIAGVRYELYKKGDVPQYVPYGANVVVSDYGITPYDILNEDGTLRGPSKQ